MVHSPQQLELAHRPTRGGLDELVGAHLARAERVVTEVIARDDRRDVALAVEVKLLERVGAFFEVGFLAEVGPHVDDRAAALDALLGLRVHEGSLEDEEVAVVGGRDSARLGEDDAMLTAVRAVFGGEIEAVEEADRDVGAGATWSEGIAASTESLPRGAERQR